MIANSLLPDKLTQIFGFRVSRRSRGKLQSVLEKMNHGHHVFRACARNAVLRMYEKFSTFLRLEALSNNLKDFGLKKSLDHLDAVRQKLAAATDRLATFEAEALNVHVDFPLFQRLALPIPSGRSRVPGIRIQDTRMIRLMEVFSTAEPKSVAGARPGFMQPFSPHLASPPRPAASRNCDTTSAR